MDCISIQSAQKGHIQSRREERKEEKSIEQWNEEKAKLEAMMADPAFYDNASKIADTQKKYAAILKKLEDAEE